jgi:site-specific recombinase XerD
MRQAGNGIHAARVRGLIVVLWRAGLRINEALMLTESDVEPRRAAILVRHGKGGECRYRHTPPYVRERTVALGERSRNKRLLAVARRNTFRCR